MLADGPLWSVYDEAIPPEEREPREVIAASIRRGVGLAAVLRDGGEAVAMATVHLLRDPAAVFLVYLTVRRDLRGTGLGGRTLEAVLAAGRTKLRADGVEPLGAVWECDDPGRASGPERERRERRIRFFGHHGAQVLDAPYVQPPVDGVTPVPMVLLWRPWTPALPALEPLIDAIYDQKYGAVNGIPAAVLDGLRGR